MYAERSTSIAAALNDAIGYEHAAELAQNAAAEHSTVREAAMRG